jgi:hypothetical protein
MRNLKIEEVLFVAGGDFGDPDNRPVVTPGPTLQDIIDMLNMAHPGQVPSHA